MSSDDRLYWHIEKMDKELVNIGLDPQEIAENRREDETPLQAKRRAYDEYEACKAEEEILSNQNEPKPEIAYVPQSVYDENRRSDEDEAVRRRSEIKILRDELQKANQEESLRSENNTKRLDDHDGHLWSLTKDAEYAAIIADISNEELPDQELDDATYGLITFAVRRLRNRIEENHGSLTETDSVVDRQGSKLDQIEDDLNDVKESVEDFTRSVSGIENKPTNMVEQVKPNMEVGMDKDRSNKRSWLPWAVAFLFILVLVLFARNCTQDQLFSVDSVKGTDPAVESPTISLKQAEDACEHGLASYDPLSGAFSCNKPAPAAVVVEEGGDASFIQQDVELPPSGSVAPVKCELDKIGTFSELPGGPHRIEIGGHGIQHVDFYPAVGVKAVSFIVPNFANPEGVPAIWHGYGSIWEGQLDECGSFGWVADATQYAKARLDSGHSGIVVDLRSGKKVVANVANMSADDIDGFLALFYAAME